MTEDEYEEFLRIHLSQLLEIPQNLWRTLATKVHHEIFDAGLYFQMSKDGDGWHVYVTNVNGIKADDPDCVFLVDHAWTFEYEFAEQQLQAVPALTDRMLNLMDIESAPENGETLERYNERKVAMVLEKMWKYCGTYDYVTVQQDSDGVYQMNEEAPDKKITPWYIMDEFGSRFAHSMNANVIFRVFIHIPTGIVYTIIFPKQDIEMGQEATRQYTTHTNDLESHLFPWYPELFNFEHVDDDWVDKSLSPSSLPVGEQDIPDEPDLILERVNLPKFKVYSTCETVKNYVTLDRIKFVDKEDDADIFWLSEHVRSFKKFFSESESKILNQIPNEKILNHKDLFTFTAMQSIPLFYYPDGNIPQKIIDNRGPLWLMPTFDISNELSKFIRHFEQRKVNGFDNHWIVKPSNMARGIGITITENLDHIIRLADTLPPKIACKYIENPVLFYRDDIGDWVKHEMRFQVFIKSVDPLEVYVHDIFYLRFANHPFKMANFNDYQTHFCIMAYKGFDLLQIPDKEYMEMFEKQYPHLKWSDIKKDTYQAIKDLLITATLEPPPRGLYRSKRCVAAYGFDLIYRWTDEEKTKVQPVILEVNFMPQTSRGSKMYPPYWNEVFETLFLDGDNSMMIKL